MTNQLQAQYNKAIEQNKQLQQKLKAMITECTELKKEYEDILDSRQREWEGEYEYYRQALNDIKKLITDNNNYFMKEILDIIDDVINQ